MLLCYAFMLQENIRVLINIKNLLSLCLTPEHHLSAQIPYCSMTYRGLSSIDFPQKKEKMVV